MSERERTESMRWRLKRAAALRDTSALRARAQSLGWVGPTTDDSMIRSPSEIAAGFEWRTESGRLYRVCVTLQSEEATNER